MTDSLKLVGDYAAEVARSEANTDRGSMEVAQALHDLYTEGAWVDEWLIRAPISKRPGPAKAKTKDRFYKWVEWRLLRDTGDTLGRRRQRELFDAAELLISAPGAGINAASERAMRPLRWLLSTGRQAAFPEVWRIAEQLAAGGPVTSVHTAKALAEWKHVHLPPGGKLSRVEMMRSERLKAKTHIFKMLNYATDEEMSAFLKDMATMVQTKRWVTSG